MRGVAFLPEEFARAQEQARAHFPAHYVAPLVYEQRQVAVRMYPVAESVPDNRFRCGADYQLFFEFRSRVYHNAGVVFVCFQTIMRNYGAFFCKAFYVLGFF